MWQKLNRIDSFELEKARIQLINAVQLVSAGPRSYVKNSQKSYHDWLYWDMDTSSIISDEFGTKEKARINLDIEGFVLSIFGKNDHREHLVLSGLSYPMAFGWMKIKLDGFHFEGDSFNDNTPYQIAKTLGPDEDMNVSNQDVFHDLVLYFSNACDTFEKLKSILGIQGTIRVNPENLNLVLLPESQTNVPIFGFSPGDQTYPEPYYYLKLTHADEKVVRQLDKTIGIWNTKDWNGWVLLSNEFVSTNFDHEQVSVSDFFQTNYRLLFLD